jgi:hypothetical protein
MSEWNYRYYEEKCNIYGCDFGSNPDPDDTCMYCGREQKDEE